jgi:hypothetical protein
MTRISWGIRILSRFETGDIHEDYRKHHRNETLYNVRLTRTKRPARKQLDKIELPP